MPAWITSLLRALMPGAEGVFRFEDQHFAALRGQRTGDGEADHSGADHGAFDFFHGLVAEFVQRLRRQG
jgi:hypothetical protein